MATQTPRASPPVPQETPGRRWPVLAALLLVGPLLYGSGWCAAWVLDGRPQTQVVAFDPAAAGHLAAGRVVAAATMSVGGVLLLIGVPWLLGTVVFERIQRRRATAAAWSLAANSAALILVCWVLRGTLGVERGGFLVAWLLWTAVLFLLASRPAPGMVETRCLWRSFAVAALIGLAVATVAIVLFSREHFIQCFNGDGTEAHDLARSLRQHFLPYWDIETARRFGTYVVNPVWINSYWTLGLQLLLGEGELATRLPCWIWWLGVFGISLRMVQAEGRTAAWLPAIPLAMALLLVSVWYTFYVGYYPYLADPANPGVPDALFTLLLLLGWDCLRRGDCAGWAVSAILASLVFYAGLVMFVLTAAAACLWRPAPRGQVVRAAVVGVLVLGGVACGYLLVGWHEGALAGWWSTLHREVFRKYASPGPQHAVVLPAGCLSLLFVGYFCLGCGAVPVLGLLRPFARRSADHDVAWERTVATTAICYLLIILGSGHKNLHYLGPLLPIPLILWLRSAYGGGGPVAIKRWLMPLSAAGCLAVCVYSCWPAARPIFTLNRKLGAATTFQTDSFEQACRWGEITWDLYSRGDLAWQVGEHTWADYAQHAAHVASPRPLLVTDGQAPSAEYQLVFSQGPAGAKLYCRDPRVIRWCRDAHEQPLAALHRWPRVFRPIATVPLARNVEQP